MQLNATMTQSSSNHPSVLTLERFLPYRLSILSNRISGVIAETYKDKFALSITQWRIMAVLGEYPGASADEVSAKIQIEKSMVSRALQKLLARNLVSREMHASDRRRQNLSLTHTGLEIYQQVVPLSYDYENQLQACFTKEEREVFDSLIDRLYQHAQGIDWVNVVQIILFSLYIALLLFESMRERAIRAFELFVEQGNDLPSHSKT